MQININRNSLNRCLEIVEKALPTRTTIPAVNNIFFECTEKELIFSATNLEISIQLKIFYPNEENFKILLPSKIVSIVRHLPDDDVNIFLNRENFCIKLVCGQATFDLFGADPVDYPIIETSELVEYSVNMEQTSLKQALKTSIFAASMDESRPAFNGVLFCFNQNQIELTASDTYRLVVKDIKDIKFSIQQHLQEQRSLIPAKSLRELLKIIGNDGLVQIIVGVKKVIFNFNDIIFTTRVLDEKYPDISVVIPRTYKTRAVVNKNILEGTVARASLLAEGINQVVYFSINERGLNIKVSSKIGRMEEMVDAKIEGENVDVYVNSKFILDILRLLEEEEVQIDFHGKNGPLVFIVPGDKTYLYLMLPIKID